MDIFTATMIADGAEEAAAADQLRAWAALIQSGVVWELQGCFGRMAARLIEQGIISPDGEIDWDVADVDPDEVLEDEPEPEPDRLIVHVDQLPGDRIYEIAVNRGGEEERRITAVGGYRQVYDSLGKQYGEHNILFSFRLSGPVPDTDWITVTDGHRRYLVSPRGMWYDGATDPDLAILLESGLLHAGRYGGHRLRFHYGDPITGEAWGDMAIGYIGRSTGWRPCPLVINNSRSMGGPALLTHCIVKIDEARAGRRGHRFIWWEAKPK